PTSTLFPYTTLFRSYSATTAQGAATATDPRFPHAAFRRIKSAGGTRGALRGRRRAAYFSMCSTPSISWPTVCTAFAVLRRISLRSEEHTSELQSRFD